MNRTQKGALAALIGWTVLGIFGIILFSEIAFLGKFFIRFHLFYFVLFIALLIATVVFIRKKQSPAEVESDERDNLIQLRAVLASFVSVWILLAIATLVPRLILGIEGTIALWVLSIINFVIFLIAMIIYSAAILIQYGRRGKDHE